MDYREYIDADSIVPTFEFDVIDSETAEQVLVNGKATKPDIDFSLYPSGLGFSQTIDVVTGDTIDYILEQTLEKEDIKLTLMWKGGLAYFRYKNFLKWLSTYNDLDSYRIRFSYILAEVRRYVEVGLKKLEPKGRTLNWVSAELTLQPLSPFYEEASTTIMVTATNRGKIYNYVYPYYYGGGAYSSSNTITNDYIKDVPLRITLTGPMAYPTVTISEVDDDGNVGEVYGNVQFNNGFSIDENQKIIIDAFNSRIYLETTNSVTGVVTTEDLFYTVDKSYQSFLFAHPGKSKIAASLDEEGATCSVYYVRYVL